jgi:hypothetical protein
MYNVGLKHEKSVSVQPGRYTYPMSFQLPTSLPASFEGEHGTIHYNVQFVADRSWLRSNWQWAKFTVVNLRDLNKIPSAVVSNLIKTRSLIFIPLRYMSTKI